jgi:hypothetical protein
MITLPGIILNVGIREFEEGYKVKAPSMQEGDLEARHPLKKH